jgi:hypothetical protein
MVLTNVGTQIQLLAPHTFEVLDTLEDMFEHHNGETAICLQVSPGSGLSFESTE